MPGKVGQLSDFDAVSTGSGAQFSAHCPDMSVLQSMVDHAVAIANWLDRDLGC